jgi:molybdopterin-containing oxidoreductase family iron-sulfur binding subunit
MKRRDFLKLLGIGGTTIALEACSSEPPKNVIPYLVPPEGLIPGIAQFYATVCRECPAGCGMIVRTREGRALKAEGNPLHPVNKGKLCARGQASLQGLYHPDRIKQPLKKDKDGSFQPISWVEGEKLLTNKISDLLREDKGSHLAFIAPLVTGSLDTLIRIWLQALGSDKYLVFEPFAYESLKVANRISFGKDSIPAYDLAQATFVISFGADFLETWISPICYAQAFAQSHTYKNGKKGVFVQVEPRMSLTAANADQWFLLKPGTELALALGMIHQILQDETAPLYGTDEEIKALKKLVNGYDPGKVSSITGLSPQLIERLARRFANGGKSLALGGGISIAGSKDTALWIAINLLNYIAGNFGKTIKFGPNSNLTSINSFQETLEFLRTLSRGEVDLLFIGQVNPVFTLPPSTGFVQALEKVPFKVSFASFLDETASLADLILPDHTPLESWGDYEPCQGVYGLMQPTMNPVFNTKPIGDILISVAKKLGGDLSQKFPWDNFAAYLRDSWRKRQQKISPDTDFETFFAQAIQRGGIWKEVPIEPVQLSQGVFAFPFEEIPEKLQDDQYYLILYPSTKFFDGRGANRPWLKELPDPISKIVWDSWVEINPETASALGIKEGELITLESQAGKIDLPAHIFPGIRADTLAIPIGLGHQNFSRWSLDELPNPLQLLPNIPDKYSGGLPWSSSRVKVTRTGNRYSLVTTQGSSSQHGRGIAQTTTLAELSLGRSEEKGTHWNIYKPITYQQYHWAMVIDLDACIGCSACVVACYAENNIPVVGKELVAKGYEMSWLWVERYFENEAGYPKTIFIPMLCQQCDNAPCEPVCPVFATYHNPEGLNAQIYNRCVGTRYCSNNCPYKARRFNWFTYEHPTPMNWQLNPDVTVRTKGVMEKCTFCIQRIREGKDLAKDAGRKVREGEIVPACAQTCPTNAIIFGNLKDPDSRVSRLWQDSRGYRVLEHLNTKPSITYLKRVKITL